MITSPCLLLIVSFFFVLHFFSELTALKITVTDNEDQWCSYSAIPNFKALGKKCGKEMGNVKKAITGLGTEALVALRQTGKITVAGFDLTADEIVVTRQFAGDAAKYSALDSSDGTMVVAVDMSETAECVIQWLGREAVSCVQKLRKASGLKLGEPIEVFFSEETATKGSTENPFGLSYATAFADAATGSMFSAKVGGRALPLAATPEWPNEPLGTTVSKFVPCSKLTICIARPGLAISAAAISKDYPDCNVAVAKSLVSQVASGSFESIPSSLAVVVDGSRLELRKGTHYFENAAALVASGGVI